MKKLEIKVFFLYLGLFLFFVASMAFVQFSFPDMPDNDGFYHIKFAKLMRSEGLKPEFTWLPQTILNKDEFYDHHFLFHVVLIPFTFDDLRLGAKWSAVIFSSLAFLAIWHLFRKQYIPLAWLWALALLGISDAFLYRMSITRAQSLSLGVLALGFSWLLEGKHLRLGVLAFLYVWLYDAFPLLPLLALFHLLMIAILEHRFEYRSILFVGVGIILGLLINPYFPENIVFSFRHMMPKLIDATSVRVGNEWYPYDTGQLLKNSLLALIAFGSGIVALGLTGKKMDVRTGTGLLATLLFGFMLFQARRFIEYFPPFALIFAAFAWAPLLSNLKLDSSKAKNFSIQKVLPIIFAVAVAVSIVKVLPATQLSIQKSKPYSLYADASAWLIENSAKNDKVFQTDWDDFPRLFYYNTHNTYLTGLDPTYMQFYDQELYTLWILITQGKVEQPSRFIDSRFHARFVHSDLKHRNFIRVAEQDPGLREVFRDDQAVVFEVIQ
ncbi:MAG: hypothetical protein HN736_12230 [Anaerolineae bacterium]|jgi:hypothetical protein|nr:hypothetical protein [Anaerolineae bacterium]MBT4458299.1 hypothetical protein [Anaerolineae bacterium]MBT6061826.1 hypothetical protein [Anaerolineae bacterium]MBT6322679.1 hypothetical protein [Anaerolineae bacterium]MBT6811999.1 hypothetical protein [Anaerolineae bacterium]